MPFAVQSNNNDAEIQAAEQVAEQEVPVTVPETEARAIEEASPNFELTTLPARKGGFSGGGPRGPRGFKHITEEMIEAVVTSEDPNAAIATEYKTVSKSLKAKLAERTLRLVSREGVLYLAKLPAEDPAKVDATEQAPEL